MSNHFTVTPVDVSFFRGNKTFYYGEWFTEGVFPPLPSTFQGFLRSKMLDDNKALDGKGKAIGNPAKFVGDDETFPFEISGPFLWDENSESLFLPTPRDLSYVEKDHTFLEPLLNGAIPLRSDLEFEILAADPSAGKVVEGPPFLSFDQIADYCLGEEVAAGAEMDLWKSELRTGISLDLAEKEGKFSRGIKKEMYYMTSYIRLRPGISFYFSLREPFKVEPGYHRLGSEGKGAFVKPIASLESGWNPFEAIKHELASKIQASRVLRLVTAQPSVFEAGWFPFQYTIQERRLKTTVHGVTLRLLNAVIGNPIRISGYSFTANKSSRSQEEVRLKSAVLAAPAGSVFTFEVQDGVDKIEAFLQHFGWGKIENGNYSRMGFNQVFTAAGPNLPGGM